MTHALYDIWEEKGIDWRAQLVNFVGTFRTRALAEKYVASVNEYRAKNGLDVVKKTKAAK